MNTVDTNAAASPPPPSVWDKVRSSIPVVMTVLATLLAGLSSSEMTQAQYHRSLAAQYQSKVGDQWNFFQAKRQRGAIVLGQMDALRAELASSAGGNFVNRAERLREGWHRAASRTGRLHALLEKFAHTIRLASLSQVVSQLRDGVAEQTDAVQDQFNEKLHRTAPPYSYRDELRGEHFKDPREALRSELATFHPHLPDVLDAIDRRKPEAEIAAGLADIRPEQLHEAIDRLQTRADQFDDHTRDTVKRFERANELVAAAAEGLQPILIMARLVEDALNDLPAGANEDPSGLRAASEDALRAVRHIGEVMAALVRSMQLARNEYNERRYECEARYNQLIAGLYEAQVRKSSLTAEKHRQRSYLFFYCMLVAQAGVTIATLALAVRQLSVLWSLATLAGLAAMAAGVYVYLFR